MHWRDLPLIKTKIHFVETSHWLKYPVWGTSLNSLVEIRLDVIEQIFLEHILYSYDKSIFRYYWTKYTVALFFRFGWIWFFIQKESKFFTKKHFLQYMLFKFVLCLIKFVLCQPKRCVLWKTAWECFVRILPDHLTLGKNNCSYAQTQGMLLKWDDVYWIVMSLLWN